MIRPSTYFTRRNLLGLLIVMTMSLLAACGTPAVAPAADEQAGDTPAADAGGMKEVPRNRTHIIMGGGREGQYIDHELWNPYAIGANHQTGPNIMYEPLAFYSAFADEELMWLAESYSYNDDFTELTIKTREGITWSDGVPLPSL